MEEIDDLPYQQCDSNYLCVARHQQLLRLRCLINIMNKFCINFYRWSVGW